MRAPYAMATRHRDRTDAGRALAAALGGVADDVVCARTTEPFVAVGLRYDDFTQTGDEEAHALLARARRPLV